jgi:hypothetical protein
LGLSAVIERRPDASSTAAIDLAWVERPFPRAAIEARNLASTLLVVCFEPTGRPREAAIALSCWRSLVAT